MKVLHWPRRQGKTTLALQTLKDNPRCALICMCGARCSQVINENKDLKDRIFSIWDLKKSLRGKHLDSVIIDDGDCVPLSLLLESINFLQEMQIKIIVTTSV